MNNGRKRWQKFSLGVLYLGAATALGWKGLTAGADPVGLGVLLTGLATGIGAIVYGNIMEHRARAMQEGGK